jgi:hypothetical protein
MLVAGCLRCRTAIDFQQFAAGLSIFAARGLRPRSPPRSFRERGQRCFMMLG